MHSLPGQIALSKPPPFVLESRKLVSIPNPIYTHTPFGSKEQIQIQA